MRVAALLVAIVHIVRRRDKGTNQNRLFFAPCAKKTFGRHSPLSGIGSEGNETLLPTTIEPLTHTYDKNGNRITQLRQNAAASNLPMAMTATNVAYDAVGNRTTNGSVVNTANQLTADANSAYQYDDNGNLTRKTLLATGNYIQYTSDAENRLTRVQEFAAENPTAITTSAYRYDGLGRRIEKIGNGITRRYVYDRDQILLEYDGGNVLQARYTYGPRTDEPIAVTRGANTFYYHADGLNSITDLTDGNGATVQSYAYDVWGNVLDQTGVVKNSITYTGRERDTESSLYYYRARSYDPLVGRFIESDPIGFAGDSPNLYLYVRDNPANFTDPLGLRRRTPIAPIRPPLSKGPTSCSYYDQVSGANGGTVPVLLQDRTIRLSQCRCTSNPHRGFPF